LKEAPQLAMAARADLPAVKQLLSRCGLPVDDVDRHIERFMVAKDRSGIVAVAGLQRAGPYALLRSVAVAEERRREGTAQRLCNALFARAKKDGVSRMYLLTTTAAKYFANFGFEPVDRMAAPAEITGTEEFAKLCPASATVMVKTL